MNILRETRPPKTNAGIQEPSFTYSRVHLHTLFHFKIIHAHLLTNIRDLISKRHILGQIGISSILDHLSTSQTGSKDLPLKPFENLQKTIPRSFVQLSDDDSSILWKQEIVNCSSLSEELWIHTYAEINSSLLARKSLKNGNDKPFGGSWNHGALNDYHVITAFLFQRLTYALRNRFNLP